MTCTRFAYLTAGAALCAAVAVSGCSSSAGSDAASSGGTTPAASLGGASASGGAPTASSNPIQQVLGSGGPLDVSKLCAAVPHSDVQKLFKAPAPAVVSNPGECDWGSATGGVAG
jgi:hypothetical protein